MKQNGLKLRVEAAMESQNLSAEMNLSPVLFVWKLSVANPGWLEFGLAGLPGTGGGQECGGAERGECGQILDPSESQGDGA